MTAKSNSIRDGLHFLSALLARPKNVGAILPSGPELARAMAAEIDPGFDGPVLELGPGTGVVTEAIIARGVAPGRIVAIEYDPDFARRLAQRYPSIQVIRGDAFDLAHTLDGHARGGHASAPFAAILSGLPLLNFPLADRRRLIDGVFERLAPGAPFIQFSYGLNSPVMAGAGFSVRRAAMVWKNLPPARVWVYRAK